MNSTWIRWAVAAIVASFGVKVFAHARVVPTGTLVPRSDDSGVKMGPCGNYTRIANPPSFSPGQTIQFNWEETVNHPGRFEIYFSQAGETGWQLLKTITDTQNGSGNLPHAYSTTITLPNMTCTDCTLQLIQVMTEDVNNPSYYYSCVDLKLQSGTGGTQPGPTPSPNPSPAPSPAACP